MHLHHPGGTSLTYIDHPGTVLCQSLFVPISKLRENLKAVVEEQGFHLLWKDIAKSKTCRFLTRLLLSSLPISMQGVKGVVLDLSEMIILLVRGDYYLLAIRSRVGVLVGFPPFKEIIARGIARPK